MVNDEGDVFPLTQVKNLYYLDCEGYNQEEEYACSTQGDVAKLWHKRMAHLGRANLKKLPVMALGVPDDLHLDEQHCLECLMGKHTAEPFPEHDKENSRKYLIGEKLHSDVCGPIMPASKEEKYYMATFIDNESDMSFAYVIHHKNEVKDCLGILLPFLERQTGNKLKCIQTDGGKEYLNNEVERYCQSNGIIHQVSIRHTPQQNGRAERLNRTLLEKTRCLLHASKAPMELIGKLWKEALLTANYLRNVSPTSRNGNQTPHEKFWKFKPNLSRLRVFGCEAFVQVPNADREGKLDKRTISGIMVGYEADSKGYRILNMEDPDQVYDEILVSRNVKFNEDQMPLGQIWDDNFTTIKTYDGFYNEIAFIENELVKDNGDSDSDPEEAGQELESEPGDLLETTGQANNDEDGSYQDEASASEENESIARVEEHEPEEEAVEIETSLPGGFPAVKDYLGSLYEYVTKDTPATRDINSGPANPGRRMTSRRTNKATLEDIPGHTIPITLEQAKKLQDWPLWEQAIIEELQSIRDNGTGVLVPRPSHKNVVKSKIVFDIKKDDHGNIQRYKARNVARGFSQIEGVDYFDTSSPVIKASSLKILLSIIAHEDMDMVQIDVKTAFLIPRLKEELYLEQTIGYEDRQRPNYVWKLEKAIYGLKQSGFEWNAEADARIKEIGFKPSKMDPCVYVRGTGKERLLSGIYVDDGIIAGGSRKERDGVIAHMKKYWEVKELGEPEIFVSITIKRDRKAKQIHVSQPKQILSLLEVTGMEKCNPVDSPWEMALDFTGCEEEETVPTWTAMKGVPYRTVIGKLIYALVTRPDIVVPVSMLAKHQMNPKEVHWKAVKRLLRYLKGTIHEGISLGGEDPLVVRAYCDADWGAEEDCKARTGIALQISNGFPLWYSKKQTLVALSTAEAEFIAINEAVKEVTFARIMLEELGVPQDKPTEIKEDNQSCISMLEAKWAKGRTKHVDRRVYNIQDAMDKKKISVVYCPTQLMVADMMTKNFAKPRFLNLKEQWGVDNGPQRMERVNTATYQNMNRYSSSSSSYENPVDRQAKIYARLRKHQQRSQEEHLEMLEQGNSFMLYEWGPRMFIEELDEEQDVISVLKILAKQGYSGKEALQDLPAIYTIFFKAVLNTEAHLKRQTMGAVETPDLTGSDLPLSENSPMSPHLKRRLSNTEEGSAKRMFTLID